MDVAIKTDIAETMTRSKHMALSLKANPDVVSLGVAPVSGKRSF